MPKKIIIGLRPTRSDRRPASGWIARELICTSINNRYRECPAPFRGRAVVTYQISQSACIEGESWGQKAGMIWVDRGCRARFGMVVDKFGVLWMTITEA